MGLDTRNKGSWAIPRLHKRIPSQGTAFEKASAQLRSVQKQLPVRAISLWDAEKGCAPFLLATANIPPDKVIRLRPNLNLAGPRGPYKGRGRYPVHGDKFKFKDLDTWREPDPSLEMNDPDLGMIQVKFWKDLHFRTATKCPMIVARLERLESKGTRRLPKVIWVAGMGEEPPEPLTWGQRSMRRYTVDHGYRFAKQRLYWTMPMVSTPEQGERWSDRMPRITCVLWLARHIGMDKPWPWQKNQTELTPGRVCQGMRDIFAEIDPPTQMPKPRGNAPSWPKGQQRTRRERFDGVKRHCSSPTKAVSAA